MAQRKRANSRTRHTRHQGLLGPPWAHGPHQTQLQHRQPSCFFALRLDSSAHLLCLPLLAPNAEVSGLIRTTCSAWGSSNVPSARAQMPAGCVVCVCVRTGTRVCASGTWKKIPLFTSLVGFLQLSSGRVLGRSVNPIIIFKFLFSWYESGTFYPLRTLNSPLRLRTLN